MKIVSFFKLCEEDISDLIRIQKNQALMKKLPEYIFDLEQQLNIVRTSMEELMSENAALKQEIVRLDKAVESDRSSQNAAHDGSVKEVERKLAAFISNFASNSSDTEKRLLRLENENSSLARQIRSLAEANRVLNERLSQNEIQLQKVADDNQKLVEQVLLLNTENKSQSDRIWNIVKNIPAAKTGKFTIPGSPGEKRPSPTLSKAGSLEPFKSENNASSVIKPETVVKPEFEMSADGKNLLHYNNLSKRHVIIPIGIEKICTICFFGCKMESIAIPEGVECIDEAAFTSCNRLREVILPNSTRKLGNRAFSNCSALESIIIPKDVTDIGADAFNDCPKLMIKCAANSPAEKYAKKAKILYLITFLKSCTSCGFSTPLLDKKKCPVCGAKDWKNNF